MGIESIKAPPLPAPTESDTISTPPTELATDVSRPQDDNKSSYSLPDDGTPVTIKTRGHKPNRSQTSLLIEYFEGGKSDISNPGNHSSKPSVRVRLTPSKTRGKNDRIQITETKSTRKGSMSKKAVASPAVSRSELELDPEETRSMNSCASATEESNVSRNPIEVEINPSHYRRRERKVSSPLIPAADSKASSYVPPNMSDISAIGTDSFLDGSGNTTNLSQVSGHGKNPSRSEAAAASALGAVAGAVAADRMNRKNRTVSDDRRIIEKSLEKASKPERKHKSKSRTSSISGERDVDKSSPRRRSKGGHKESVLSAADSSVLSSQITQQSHRSYDSHSSSKISINNPKLLETVEDAIRRLILPELDAIKRERSQRETRRSKDRDSLSSLTSASREDISVTSKRRSGDTAQSTKSRGREARNDLSTHSSVEQISVIDSVQDDEETPRPRKDRLGDAALLGAAAAAGVAISGRDTSRVDDKRQRRRRRGKTPERGRAAEDYDEEHDVVPPMPLSSEINPSEMTRTSILSAETDRPHSASDELMPVHEVTRGSVESVHGTPTPTRTPVTLQALGAQHANVSHGDLKNLPRQGTGEFEDENEGRYEDSDLSQRYHDDYDEYDDAGHMGEPAMYDQSFFGHQDVPAPLRYIPYQQERRGLSPIESVSGYTESDLHHRRDSKVQSELSSPSKSPRHTRELQSQSSIPSNLRSREFGDEASSVRSSGNYRNTTYTDDSELDRVTSGQAVRGLGANPEFVHPAFGAESAVASLVDGSVIEPSLLSAGQDYRDSQLSYGEIARGSGGSSPAKRSVGSHQEVTELRGPSPVLSKKDASNSSREFAEYDLDEYGRKYEPVRTRQSPDRQSPTASEQETINAAVRAAAAASKAKKGISPHPETQNQFVGEGVFRNQSFKERAKTDGYQPNTTPRHSVDRLSENYYHPKMSASGLPDVDHPMPEIGYGYDDERQTPSIIEGPLDGSQRGNQDHWPAEQTPTQDKVFDYDKAVTPKASRNGHRGLGLADAAAVGALVTAGAMAASHSRQPSQDQDDEWQRTSGDRKRDTLLTNPYEGTSPIANLPGLDGNMLGASGYGVDGYRGGFNTGSPGIGQGDEGYISAAPNEVRDVQNAKGKGVGFTEQAHLARKPEDPFYGAGGLQSTRHLSGMSQGLGSPLYDAAMGTGIDRIQSKDIIALMEHLMVRDAQRSARDTEMLVTLVRSAAEMRNSFNDIKRLLADTEDQIIGEVKENTDKTVQKHLGGPRPFPGSAPRSTFGGSQAGTIEDLPAKKRNLFRRALKSLGAKGSNDLGKIEDMLNHLLTEVDELKNQSTGNPIAMIGSQNRTLENIQPEVQYEQDRGYEPEGNAGTSTASHASQSGHLSIPQSRGGTSMKQGYERKFSDHRISTVPEDSEEEYHQPAVTRANQYSNPDLLMSPAMQPERGASEALGTPPQHGAQVSSAPNSYENTPLTDANKKHKRGSSGFLPKISRWSETTTSSIGRVFRHSGTSRKNDQGDEFLQHAPSRSGSDLGQYEYSQPQHVYGEDKLHTGFSEQDLNNPDPMQQPGTPTRIQLHDPPVTYSTPEDPKYKVHRNSLNLQHPQPRPGQSERFRTALETSAQDYDSPMSPRSADWAGSATSLNRFPGQEQQHNDQGYAWSSPGPQQAQQAPPRPPKEPLDSVSPPQNNRVNKLQKKQPGSPLPSHGVESGYGSGSPKPENRNLSSALGQPTRRPSGPRAMTPSRMSRGESRSPANSIDGRLSVGSQGNGEDRAREERRRKRDTFGTHASQESETF